MNVTTEVTQNLEPAQLAKALANASPEEFAAFWRAFGEEAKQPAARRRIEEFAKEIVNRGAAEDFLSMASVIAFHQEACERGITV